MANPHGRKEGASGGEREEFIRSHPLRKLKPMVFIAPTDQVLSSVHFLARASGVLLGGRASGHPAPHFSRTHRACSSPLVTRLKTIDAVIEVPRTVF